MPFSAIVKFPVGLGKNLYHCADFLYRPQITWTNAVRWPVQVFCFKVQDAMGDGDGAAAAGPFLHGTKKRGMKIDWQVWPAQEPFCAEVLYPHDFPSHHLRGRINFNASRALTVQQAKAFMSSDAVSTSSRFFFPPRLV